MEYKIQFRFNAQQRSSVHIISDMLNSFYVSSPMMCKTLVTIENQHAGSFQKLIIKFLPRLKTLSCCWFFLTLFMLKNDERIHSPEVGQLS